ncbi:MAG: AMP-binding protein, partial [Betaproteobacteria bacterium]
MDLSTWITRHAQRTPDQTALRFAGESIGYAALAQRIGAIAGALAARGVARGERVAWLGLNSADLLATLFACARLGAVFVPLNWRLAPPEHRAILDDCTPALLVAESPFAEATMAPAGCARIALGAGAPAGWTPWADFLAGARGPLVATVFDDGQAPLLLCHTSGSTGRPKGVLLSQRALECNAANSADMHALAADDRVLTTLPLFHVGGLNIQTLPALQAGATVTLHPKFDPDACLDAIERERITLTVLVPAQLDALLAHPRWASADLSSLRMITTGSTLVPMRLVRAVHARGVPLAPVWGATETAPIAACLHADEAVEHAGTTGRAARRCALRV